MRWVKHPKGLSAVEAASIWMMFVTAYGALIEDAKITSQDAVVIPGASSSVVLRQSRSPIPSARSRSH